MIDTPNDTELRTFLMAEGARRVHGVGSDTDYANRHMGDAAKKKRAAFRWMVEQAKAGDVIKVPSDMSVQDTVVSLTDETQMQTTGPLSPLAQFDAGMQRVNSARGSVYGHPVENFARIQALKAIVRECEDPLAREALEEICVKMARLIVSPQHVDSWLDIAGYARTGVMCVEGKPEEDHAWARVAQ